MKPITVACHCGAVHLEITGDPVAQLYCHCDDCQAVTGGAYVPIALYPSSAVVATGEIRTRVHKTNPRTRCASCGTLLFAEPPGFDLRGVVANLLPAGIFKPSFHMYCQYAILPVMDDLPHYKRLPARFGGTDEMMAW